jgi:hypothetical protein
MEKQCILYKVRIEFLNIINKNLISILIRPSNFIIKINSNHKK